MKGLKVAEAPVSVALSFTSTAAASTSRFHVPPGDSLARLALDHFSEAISQLRKLARDHQVAILVGYVERNPANAMMPFNSAMLVDRSGHIALNYRKTHVWGDYEKRFFTRGEALAPIVELEA